MVLAVILLLNVNVKLGCIGLHHAEEERCMPRSPFGYIYVSALHLNVLVGNLIHLKMHIPLFFITQCG